MNRHQRRTAVKAAAPRPMTQFDVGILYAVLREGSDEFHGDTPRSIKRGVTMKLPPPCPPIQSWEEDPKTSEVRITVSKEWVEWFDNEGIDDPVTLQARLGLVIDDDDDQQS